MWCVEWHYLCACWATTLSGSIGILDDWSATAFCFSRFVAQCGWQTLMLTILVSQWHVRMHSAARFSVPICALLRKQWLAGPCVWQLTSSAERVDALLHHKGVVPCYMQGCKPLGKSFAFLAVIIRLCWQAHLDLCRACMLSMLVCFHQRAELSMCLVSCMSSMEEPLTKTKTQADSSMNLCPHVQCFDCTMHWSAVTSYHMSHLWIYLPDFGHAGRWNSS